MVQLTRAGLIAQPDQIASLRAEFDRNHFVLLRELLEPHLLHLIGDAIEQGRWNHYVHPGVGEERILWHEQGVPLLRFLSNLPETLSVVHEITGCGPFNWFDGRVYRMTPESGDYDSWHDDLGNGLVALSLNLSVNGYRGGLFQMRDRRNGRMLVDFANTGLGDAMLFRISEHLEHRITPVEAGEPKTAFAGWFEAGVPSMVDRMHESGRSHPGD